MKEAAEAEEGVVLDRFRSEVRKAVRNVSNVAGVRDLFYFAYARLRRLMHKEEVLIEADKINSTSLSD